MPYGYSVTPRAPTSNGRKYNERFLGRIVERRRTQGKGSPLGFTDLHSRVPRLPQVPLLGVERTTRLGPTTKSPCLRRSGPSVITPRARSTGGHVPGSTDTPAVTGRLRKHSHTSNSTIPTDSTTGTPEGTLRSRGFPREQQGSLEWGREDQRKGRGGG